MAEVGTYIEALTAIKEDVLGVLAKAREDESMIKMIQEESGVELPYVYELGEIARLANGLVQMLDVDIQAFEKKAGEGMSEETSAEEKAEDLNSLQKLVQAM